MTRERLDKLNALYAAYVDTFRSSDGTLPPMMELKRIHTAKVTENAKIIVQREGFDAATALAAEAAALLHDTGRYEQLRRFGTFRDSESVNHAVFSHDIVYERGWLKGDDSEKAILDAILFHNRRDVPMGLDPVTFAAAHTVRDADKLDIFRVLEHQVKVSDWRHDRTAFWNLPISDSLSPAVIAAIRNHQPVDYQAIKSIGDFVLIQVGWMISELHYATTRRLTLERDHVKFRRDFLYLITSNSAVDELCDIAEAALRK